MNNKRWMMRGALALGLFTPGLPGARAGEQAVFPMSEVSVFDAKALDENQRQQLLGGQYAMCGTEPDGDVKAYPKLKSKRPLYGKVEFDASMIDRQGGIRYHFVIDESGGKKSAQGQSLGKKLAGLLTGGGGGNIGYDLLYFDLNRDLDLTNDPVLKLMKDPPSELTPPWEDTSRIRLFEYLTIGFDHGPELGTRPLRILPRLAMYGEDRAHLMFTATVARKGKIRIGKHEYTALLAQSGMVTGRFDRLFTGLHLRPIDGEGERPLGWWAEWLGAMREVDGQLYKVSATPTGDTLSVEPYRGAFGRFEVSSGDRKDLKKLGASGVLMSESTAVTLGKKLGQYPYLEKIQPGKLPVGDYRPMYLSVDLGELSLNLSANRHSIDPPHGPREEPAAYNIRIRKDKPYVLDFANKPTVLFTNPPPDRECKRGEAVQLEAVMVDPALDLLISGLEDTTRKVGDMEFHDDQGKKVKVARYASLDPQIAITTASGKRVAEGKMPFG